MDSLSFIFISVTWLMTWVIIFRLDKIAADIKVAANSALANSASLPCGESFGSVLCARHIKCDCSACPERHSARQA
jgi:hypothetical protein